MLLSNVSGVLQRAMAASKASTRTISTITVIGSGLMGSGVAQVAAQAGNKVHLIDVDAKAVEKAQDRIRQSLQRVAKKKFQEDPARGNEFVEKAISLISTGTDPLAVVSKSDLIIEAIVEDLKVKQELFSKLDKAAPSHTIFASNTSSLSISDIASSTSRMDRFAGLHFFNPVPVMKLLEIVRIPETSDETYNTITTWGQSIGKVTVLCKDSPGFIVNRLLVPYMFEAMRMLERGDASAKDIDTAMKLGAGMPMGPLALADYVGLDTNYFIMKSWKQKFPDNPLFENVNILEQLYKEGKYGIKSGEGFFKYDSK